MGKKYRFKMGEGIVFYRMNDIVLDVIRQQTAANGHCYLSDLNALVGGPNDEKEQIIDNLVKMRLVEYLAKNRKKFKAI